MVDERFGGEVYNAILPSPSRGSNPAIWVGTDDGLVQLTRDGGKIWTNVTPKKRATGWVYTIEPARTTRPQPMSRFRGIARAI